MNALLQFHRIAAQRGDGLLPEFAALFERQPMTPPETCASQPIRYDDNLIAQALNELLPSNDRTTASCSSSKA